MSDLSDFFPGGGGAGGDGTVYGTGAFLGDGAEVTIPHGLEGGEPQHVTCIATANPGGYLGEVWVRKDVTNIYVGNSGSFTGNFVWSATPAAVV